jgi:uncharacterized protein YaeQ
MALKPTIYKARIALSDLDRNFYDNLNLTLACHPSETLERMAVRLLVFCLHAHQQPAFTKGLSTQDEPDLWCRTLDGQIALWIEVGEPTPERIRKACRLSQFTYIYSFNSKAPTWWQQCQGKLAQLPVTIIQFAWQEIESLTTMVDRTMDLSVTLTSNSAFVSDGQNSREIAWRVLRSQDT